LFFLKRTKRVFYLCAREFSRVERFEEEELFFFFLVQKQPVLVEKDSLDSRAFALPWSQKEYVARECCDLFLSLSGKRARARRNTNNAHFWEKSLKVVEFTSRVVGSFSGRKRL
jgi:hypothetical protein